MRQAREEMRERDWLDRIVDELQAKKEQGESPSLVEGLLNELMKRERERFLEQHPQEKANGFCRRSLRLTMGELKLWWFGKPLRKYCSSFSEIQTRGSSCVRRSGNGSSAL